MSKRTALGAAMAFVALISLSSASEAHCLGYKHMRSEVTAAVNGTTTFFTRAAYRTQKFGDRMFGWLSCKRV